MGQRGTGMWPPHKNRFLKNWFCLKKTQLQNYIFAKKMKNITKCIQMCVCVCVCMDTHTHTHTHTHIISFASSC